MILANSAYRGTFIYKVLKFKTNQATQRLFKLRIAHCTVSFKTTKYKNY